MPSMQSCRQPCSFSSEDTTYLLLVKEPKIFYYLRLGHVPEVYTSFGKRHTAGIRSDFKRFITPTLSQSPLLSSDVILYTYGSACLCASPLG